MKAFLKNYRQAPRKVQLVASLIRGKGVQAAQSQLEFLPKRAALPIKKLLKSAVDNAEKNFNLKAEDLYISDIRVDKGIILKRSMPRAMGSAAPIWKRSSHVLIVLKEKAQDQKTKVKATSKKLKSSKAKQKN